MATRAKHAQRSKRSNRQADTMRAVFGQISYRYAYGVDQSRTRRGTMRQETAKLNKGDLYLQDLKELRRSKVLSVIEAEEQNRGHARISFDDIARSSHTSKRHAMDAVNELVNSRQLEIVMKGAGNTASLYKTIKVGN